MAPTRRSEIRQLVLVLLGAIALTACLAPSAGAARLAPPTGKDYFGVTDTGVTSGFRDFARAVGKHPAVIQTFHPWGNSLHRAQPRWRAVRARPMLHITTRADDGTELTTPRRIALGYGDDYLVRLNRTLSRRRIRLYLRPLGEPNRCLNLYAGVDCSGQVRGGPYSFTWYKRAFRRIATVVRGGGRRRAINRSLRRLNLPVLRKKAGIRLPTRLRRAPVAMVWSPLPGGSPTVRINRPGRYWPGAKWVDWVATDFYNRYGSWKHLRQFYRKFAIGKDRPMALSEFGLWGRDGPRFIKRVFRFARNRERVRMLVYYQDFGSANAFRIQNFPRGRKVMKRKLASPRFPRFAARHPR